LYIVDLTFCVIWLALPASGFSIRIILFCLIELPTPVSHPPSQECTRTATRHTHPQKYICKYKNIRENCEQEFISNLVIILFSDGELSNSFLLGIVQRRRKLYSGKEVITSIQFLDNFSSLATLESLHLCGFLFDRKFV